MITDAPAAQAAPVTLRVAAGAQAAEAVGMLVATAFSAAATIGSKSYHTANGVELTVLAFVFALGIAIIARGIARAKPWSRTPAMMTQLLLVIVGAGLIDAHRLAWGIPAVILGATVAAALLAPASLNALNRGGQ
jgi:Na+-driven multidrug efflux pump